MIVAKLELELTKIISACQNRHLLAKYKILESHLLQVKKEHSVWRYFFVLKKHPNNVTKQIVARHNSSALISSDSNTVYMFGKIK